MRTTRIAAANRVLLTGALLALLTMAGVPAEADSPTTIRSLNDAWDAAEAAEGYARDLHLDPDVIYECEDGGLYIGSGMTNRIHGHGAVIDMRGWSIVIYNYRHELVLEECVFVNGGGIEHPAAVTYQSHTMATVRNCVFYRNQWGLHTGHVFPAHSNIENCIFLENEVWGAVVNENLIPSFRCCLAWGNGVGDWAEWCGCDDESEPEIFDLDVESPIYADPLLVNPVGDLFEADFHLAPGSPCFGTGTPTGINIGAYPYQSDDPLPAIPVNWSLLKSRW